MDPYSSTPPSDPFASGYAAVEQFNPIRYEEETGQTPRSLPTGTTGQSSVAHAPAPLRLYVIFALIGVVIWALERHKLRLKGILR